MITRTNPAAIHPAPIEFSRDQLTIDPILRYFHYAHLKPELAAVSKPFCAVAKEIVDHLPRNAERSTALRKLLEAKDCAVRANVPDESTQGGRIEAERTAPTLDVAEDLEAEIIGEQHDQGPSFRD